MFFRKLKTPQFPSEISWPLCNIKSTWFCKIFLAFQNYINFNTNLFRGQIRECNSKKKGFSPFVPKPCRVMLSCLPGMKMIPKLAWKLQFCCASWLFSWHLNFSICHEFTYESYIFVFYKHDGQLRKRKFLYKHNKNNLEDSHKSFLKTKIYLF